LQNLQHRLLDHSVEDTGDAELPDPATRLWDLHPLDRLSSLGSVEQLFPNDCPVLPQILRRFVDGQSINAWAG
jgi:hypothetical protein